MQNNTDNFEIRSDISSVESSSAAINPDKENIAVADIKGFVASTGQPVDLTGINVKSVSVQFKQTWSTAPYESMTYDMAIAADLRDGQCPKVVANKLLLAAKQLVHQNAAQSLEWCGRLQPHISKAFAGQSVKISESAAINAVPTLISPAEHLYMAAVAAASQEKAALEYAASRNGIAINH